MDCSSRLLAKGIHPMERLDFRPEASYLSLSTHFQQLQLWPLATSIFTAGRATRTVVDHQSDKGLLARLQAWLRHLHFIRLGQGSVIVELDGPNQTRHSNSNKSPLLFRQFPSRHTDCPVKAPAPRGICSSCASFYEHTKSCLLHRRRRASPVRV
jgi:hypothetical protein